jgi:hypothetical protein
MIKPGQLIMPRGSGSSRIVAPGFLSGIAPLTRAQASVVTTGTTPDGGVVQYGANQPRFRGPERSLILESQRTNAIPNPRGLGAVAGTPGTLPTGWNAALGAGISRQVVGTGVENGVEYVDIRYFGTSTNSSLFWTNTFAAGADAPALTVGQNLATSIYLAVVGGTMPPGDISLRCDSLDANRASLSSWPGATIGPLTSTLTRYTAVVAATHASTAFGRMALWSGSGNGTAVDVTIRYGYPQSEANVPHVSSLILPPEGTTGASTRGVDVVNTPASAIFPGGVGTVLGRTTIDSNRGMISIFVQIDDNSLNNRISISNETNSTSVKLYGISAGSQSSVSLGNLTFGTPFNWGFTFNGTSTVGSFNGGATVSPSLYPSITLNRMLLNGISSGGSNSINGAMHYTEVLPYVVSPDQLRSLVANIPT